MLIGAAPHIDDPSGVTRSPTTKRPGYVPAGGAIADSSLSGNLTGIVPVTVADPLTGIPVKLPPAHVDAPYADVPFVEQTYTLEICAVCRETGKADVTLGCTSFSINNGLRRIERRGKDPGGYISKGHDMIAGGVMEKSSEGWAP